MKFYEFVQNNSGGAFHVTDTLCHRLFIEAEDADAATIKAESLGVYFDGCDSGMDCPCCGDRWYSCSEIKLPHKHYTKKPVKTIEEYAQIMADQYGWTKPDARIFYANGKVTEISRKGVK